MQDLFITLAINFLLGLVTLSFIGVLVIIPIVAIMALYKEGGMLGILGIVCPITIISFIIGLGYISTLLGIF